MNLVILQQKVKGGVLIIDITDSVVFVYTDFSNRDGNKTNIHIIHEQFTVFWTHVQKNGVYGVGNKFRTRQFGSFLVAN